MKFIHLPNEVLFLHQFLFKDPGADLAEDVLVHHQQFTRLPDGHRGCSPDVLEQRQLLHDMYSYACCC